MKFIKYFVLLFMLISSSFFCFACDSNKDSDNSDTSNSNEKIKVNLFYFDMENPDRELEYSKGSTIIIDENENSQFIRYIRQDDDSPSSEGKYIFAGWYDNSDFLGDRIKELTLNSDVNLYAKLLSPYENLFEYYKTVETETYQDYTIHYNNITNNVYIDGNRVINDSTKVIFQCTLKGNSCSYKMSFAEPVYDMATNTVIQTGQTILIGYASFMENYSFGGRRYLMGIESSSVTYSSITYCYPGLNSNLYKSLFYNALSYATWALPTRSTVETILPNNYHI